MPSLSSTTSKLSFTCRRARWELTHVYRLKPKAGEVPEGVKYFSAVDTSDVWLAYPWECEGDIDEHDALRVNNPAV